MLFNQDQKITQTHAIMAALIDFSKAFNRIDHNVVIVKLAEMGVPSWLLKIVIGFLSDRELQVKFRDSISKRMKMPGGGPQGTILGMFLFIVLINPMGFSNKTVIGKELTAPLRRRKPMETMHFKFF